MAELGGAPNSLGSGGARPRRHHDPQWPIGQRAVTYSFLAEFDTKALTPLRHEGLDPKNKGDDQSWNLWRAGSRAISSFSQAFSAIVAAVPSPPKRGQTQQRGAGSGNTLLPAKSPGEKDGRYETKQIQFAADIPQKPTFPGGWSGHVSSGMEEYQQHDLFHPDWLNALIAANKAGNYACSTELYDLDAQSNLNPTRHAPIHRLLSVLDVDWCGNKGRTVGLNLTYGGNLDKGLGYLHFVDYEKGLVAIGAKAGGGPLHTDITCQHTLGKDADGRRVTPLHLSAGRNSGALFLAPFGDAPLTFRPTTWRTPAVEEAKEDSQPGFWKEAYLRLDREESHTAGCAVRPGMWKWQVKVPIITIKELVDPPPEPPPIIPDPFPPQPPPSPEPITGPVTGPVITGPVTGGGGYQPPPGPTGSGGSVEPITTGGGGGGIPIGFPEDDLSIDELSETPGVIVGGGELIDVPDEAVDDGGVSTDFLSGTPGVVVGGGGLIDTTIPPDDGLGIDFLSGTPGTIVGGGGLIDVPEEDSNDPRPGEQPRPAGQDGPRQTGVSVTCLAAPNLGLQAHPTTGIQVGGAGNSIPPGTEEEIARTSPFTTTIETVAQGDGTVGGSSLVAGSGTGGSFAHSDNSCSFIVPSAITKGDVLSGRYDANRGGETPPAFTTLALPGGLASLTFGHPQQSTAGLVGSAGVVMAQTSDGNGLSIMPLDSTGADATSYEVVLKNDGTFTYGGSQISTGSGGGNGGIGGSGEDGAVTQGSSTQYGSVQNMTSFSDGGYTTYPAINEPLVLKSTGAATINGTVSLDGRGYLEPA